MEIEKLEKTLKNGTQVILLRRPGYGKSLFLAGFGAGGMNVEELQDGHPIRSRTGCAHFLEHQMFRLDGRDVSQDFARMQAYCNAFTSWQETAYYFQTTADPVPPLGLLLDFVQTLDITPETIENEKGIILSEYHMYRQQPETRLFQEIFKSLYHHHPLKTDILGTEEDITQMTLEDLLRFYSVHYDPGRLVIAGVTGHELQPLLEEIERHEEAYPAKDHSCARFNWQPEPETVVRPEHTLQMDVTEPYVCIGIKLQPEGDALANARKDLAVNLWLDAHFTASSPDYQKWLDAHLISQNFGAEADFTEDHAYILVYGQTGKPEAFIRTMMDVFEGDRSVDPDIFRSLQKQLVARNLRMADHFENLAMEVLHARTMGLDHERLLAIPKEMTRQEVEQNMESVTLKNVAFLRIDPKIQAV